MCVYRYVYKNTVTHGYLIDLEMQKTDMQCDFSKKGYQHNADYENKCVKTNIL